VDHEDLEDDLEELEFSLHGQERLDAFRSRADSLSPGDFGRAEYLHYLAGFFELEGRLDEADAAYDEALEDGGHTTLNSVAGRLSVSLQRQDEPATEALTSRLWTLARAKSLDDFDFEYVGDLLEHHGRLREAMRWYTVPLRDFDPDADVDLIPIGCSNGRFRVRRALGLPHDRYDEAAPLVIEHAEARRHERGRSR
jgi:tetratricopeptide (TPR) repeat protein